MTFQVIQGDCLEVMRGLPSASVDACITDPPYGVDFQDEGWDASIPDWIADARRVSPVVAFTTGATTMWDYPRADWVGCWYREASNSRSKLGGFSHWSPILFYGSPKFAVDSIKLHAIQHSTAKNIDHPSPKPLALMRWLVQNCTKEGDTVLDPFCGSGTTGVACVVEGRAFVGVEQNARYCEIARARIMRASGIGCDIPRTPRPNRPLPLFDVA